MISMKIATATLSLLCAFDLFGLISPGGASPTRRIPNTQKHVSVLAAADGAGVAVATEKFKRSATSISAVGSEVDGSLEYNTGVIKKSGPHCETERRSRVCSECERFHAGISMSACCASETAMNVCDYLMFCHQNSVTQHLCFGSKRR